MTFQGQIQWCYDNHKCPQTSPKGPWGVPVQTEISSECKMHSELGDRNDPIKTVVSVVVSLGSKGGMSQPCRSLCMALQ